jgi:hypothetical protein
LVELAWKVPVGMGKNRSVKQQLVWLLAALLVISNPLLPYLSIMAPSSDRSVKPVFLAEQTLLY